jgi:hypothetical protein
MIGALRTLIALALASALNLTAQSTPSAVPAVKPKVTFELTWRVADPQWFQLSVDSAGQATYRSQPHTDSDAPAGEPFSMEFTMSPVNRDRIFRLADGLNHFNGEFDYHGGTRIAQTGTKTLTYEAQGKTSKTSYNWSENRDLMDLTSLFQSISSTFELGRKISFALRFDKMGLDEELKDLDEMEKSHRAAELQAIAPVLQQVVNERSTMNMTRQRALRLLKLAGSSQSPSASPVTY